MASWEDPGVAEGDQADEAVIVRPLQVAAEPRTDTIRSWLFNGIHTFAIDPRRRLGGHGHARRLLAEDRASDSTARGAWRELGPALQRQTMHSGLAELSREQRQVITLAYLEGRTNRQIAAILGVSTSTVSRRLWAALETLEEYVRRTGTWASALLLIALAHVTDRAARLGRLASSPGAADWPHRLAATVAIGVVTAAALGIIATSPDSSAAKRQGRPSTAALTATVPVAIGPSLIRPATLVAPPAIAVLLERPAVGGHSGQHTVQASLTTSVQATVAPGPSSPGCHGNPTSAPPSVPVGPRGAHPTGAPVSHPGAGGCRG